MDSVVASLKGFSKNKVFDTVEYVGHITPELALLMLEKNTDNRPLRMRTVDFLARQILAGNWVYNPQSVIIFDKRGKLLDGQHRLHAIVKANKPVPMKISLGNVSRTFGYIDIVNPKTIKDTFVKEKRKLSTEIITFLKYVAFFGNAYPEGQVMNDLIKGKLLVDNYETMSLYKNNSLITKIADTVNSMPKSHAMTRASAALTFWALCQKHSFDTVYQFMAKLYLGEDIKVGSVFYTGRNRLADLRHAKRASSAIQMVMAVTIWNTVMSGKEAARLRLPDVFPVIL